MHETQSNPITTRRSYSPVQKLLQEEHNVAEMRILKEPMHKHFQFSSPPSNAGAGYLQNVSIAFIIHLKFPRKVVILQLANLPGPPDYIKTTVRGKRAQQNNKMILMPIAHYKFHFMYSAIFEAL